MSQQKLFFATWLEAIAQDILNLGGRKKLAPKLFTDCDEDVAQDRMKACLSPGHRMQFTPAHVLKIKAWALAEGSSCTIDYEDQQLGMRHEVVDPQDESDALKREFIESVKSQQRLLERIERAEHRAQLRTVK